MINRRRDKIGIDGIDIESVPVSQIWKWWLVPFLVQMFYSNRTENTENMMKRGDIDEASF